MEAGPCFGRRAAATGGGRGQRRVMERKANDLGIRGVEVALGEGEGEGVES